jgi:hypothetical protein
MVVGLPRHSTKNNFDRLQVKKVVFDADLIEKYPDTPLRWVIEGENRKVTVLYYGDYDPTGSKMVKK